MVGTPILTPQSAVSPKIGTSALSTGYDPTFILQNPFCQTPVLGLGLGVDFTFATDNNNNNKNNPHLNFLKGTVLGDKEQGVGIRDKVLSIWDKG